ncbi:MAG: protoheme IX farnesyltransferase [Anaerolineae bacterium]|nr:protoheme IX farnesyltransferase [Anaerolineae bacterium]
MTSLTHKRYITKAQLKARLRAYWQLIKSLQTGLLLVTGLAGFMSARCPLTSWALGLAVAGSLFLAISGSTVLNMVYDRDIDARMKRTACRPLPSGEVNADEALLLGLALSWLGVGWAFMLSPLFGLIVFAGIFFDVVVYTMWLKRRTAWSIVWGGIAGGMPVLAGRALGAGQIDLVGVLLALAVLLWIPTHILTFGIKYASDYQRAGVPVFANTYGEEATRRIVGTATIAAVFVMIASIWLIEIAVGGMYFAAALGVLLLAVTILSVIRPSARLNFTVFKLASVYMLGSMLLIIMGA